MKKKSKQKTLSGFRSKVLILCCLFFLGGINLFAQKMQVSGLVTDETGEPLPGVGVLIVNTKFGVSTNIDGKYTIDTNKGDVLEFSYLGMKPQRVTVGINAIIDVKLLEDAQLLEEIVVVGYGSMKVKDLTSSITTVKADDISKTPAGQAMQALQGKVAGLQVVSSGTPGNQPKVRVRGIGSYPGSDGNNGNDNPLYVVDGIFYDNIDFLNPVDIATISVLKDASASAIYGVRAANGVVLIETKSGGYDKKTEVTFDAYYGFQRAQNVLKMANAEQYATMAREAGPLYTDAGNVDNAIQRWGRSRVNPNVPDGINTDWYKEIMRVAPIQNYSVDATGGGSKAAYSVGVSYFNQEGILDMKNEYNRFNLRSKIDFKVTDWLTIGGNTIWSQATKYSGEESAWRAAYFAVPIIPVYDPLITETSPQGYNFASAEEIGYRGNQNPMHLLKFSNKRLNIKKLMANFFLNVNLVPKKLSFKTSYSHAYTNLENRDVLLPFKITNNYKRDDAEINRKFENFSDITWDNVLTYTDNVGDHNFTAMAGTSFRDQSHLMLEAKALNFPTGMEQSWYIDKAEKKLQTGYNDGGSRLYGMSYFGRLSYNYMSKYLLYGTLRADGSSKYQEKWGYFPTVGAGWVLSEENFMKDIDLISNLKLRASWGKLGNDKIAANVGTKTASVIDLALNDVLYTGNYINSLVSSIRWELTEELNYGISANFLSNRLGIEADYYIRDTKNAAISVNAPGGGGSVLRNVGIFRNSGFELSANWNDKLSSDISYNVGLNISTLKNEVRDLYGQEYIDAGSVEFRQRSIVGQPVLAFFGYEVLGVYQNEAEIAADPIAVANGLVPGDLKFKDQNGNDKLDPEDRVVLGSYFPTFMYGGNLGFTYKNIDLSMNFYGQSGNKILNRKRGEYRWTNDTNIDADLANNRWHGEGSSNKYPSSSGLKRAHNQVMSSYYIEDGDFFRIQNIQLGYTFKKQRLFGADMPNIRVYVTADRPLTIFKYNGFNPEVDNGIDNQTYPVPAVYTLGLNIKF